MNTSSNSGADSFPAARPDGGDEAVSPISDPISDRLPPVSELDASSVRLRGVVGHQGSPSRLGDYEIVEEIGHGGMGIVFKARQVSLDRYVALKVIRCGGLASETELRRFRIEAETAATLDHPNIVPVFEIGECDGLPFFSMRLVEGTSLAELKREYHTHLRAAAALMATLARAVHHAHQRGVLHRDLKPSNVIVDAQGRPHLTDFGLAKRLHTDDQLSLSSAVLGTPNYMAPEQAATKEAAVTTAVDIYSLGAILYDILTGRPPFRGETPAETLRQVLDGECLPPRSLRPDLDPELETICVKCLEKQATRRYRSAEALAEDLERWLRHEPIQASPASAWHRAVKWARRRPTAAALIGVSLGTVLAILVLTLINQAKLTAERNVAMSHAQAATEARLLSERLRYAALIRVAAASIENGRLAGVAAMLDDCPLELRGWEWGHLRAQLPPPVWSAKAHAKAVAAMALSPDGQRLATAGEDGLVRLWSVRQGENLGNWLCGWSFRRSLAFTPDGQEIIACSRRGLIKLDVTSGKITPLLDREIASFCLSPDGRFCYVVGRDRLESYELATWTRAGAVELPPDEERVVFGDGRFLLVAGDAYHAWVYFLATAPNGLLRPLGKMRWGVSWQCAVFDPAARRLTGAFSRFLEQVTVPDWLVRWDSERAPSLSASDVASWPKLALDLRNLVHEHARPVRALALDPVHERLLSASEDGEVHVRSTPDLTLKWKLAYDASVTALVLGSNQWVIAGLSDGSVSARVLTLPAAVAQPVRLSGAETGFGSRVDFATSGDRMLVTTEVSDALAVWSRTNAHPQLFRIPGAERGVAQFRPGADEIAVSVPGFVRFYHADAPPLRLVRELPTRGTVDVMSFDRAGLLLAVSYPLESTVLGKGADLFELPTGRRRELPFLEARPDHHLMVALSPDGKTLAVVSPGLGQLDLIGTAQNSPWHKLLSSGARGSGALTFHPEGRVLACATEDHGIELWDCHQAKLRLKLTGHIAAVVSLAFSPDGRRLVSSGADHTVRIWDWELAQQLLVLPNRNRIPRCARFSPDGRSLVSTDFAPPAWLRSSVPWSGAAAAARGTDEPGPLFRSALELQAAFAAADAAFAYVERGAFDKAAESYRRSWEISRKVLGEDDPRTARFQQSLAEARRRAIP